MAVFLGARNFASAVCVSKECNFIRSNASVIFAHFYLIKLFVNMYSYVPTCMLVISCNTSVHSYQTKFN